MSGNSYETQPLIPSEFTDGLIRELYLRGVINPTVVKKKRIKWENKYAAEYVKAVYPEALSWFRHEVGRIPPDEEPMLFARTRRWADAIVVLVKEVLIMEFKMRPDIKAVSQVWAYMGLFPETPEFKSISKHKVRGQIISPLEDTTVRKLATDWGIDYIVYKPSFYDEWAKTHILHEGVGVEPTL